VAPQCHHSDQYHRSTTTMTTVLQQCRHSDQYHQGATTVAIMTVVPAKKTPAKCRRPSAGSPYRFEFNAETSKSCSAWENSASECWCRGDEYLFNGRKKTRQNTNDFLNRDPRAVKHHLSSEPEPRQVRPLRTTPSTDLKVPRT
jgi:hypothetical protein